MQDEVPDPMLQEQFQLALDATQIRSRELIEACRSVLVNEKLATEVVQQHKIDVSSVSRGNHHHREVGPDLYPRGLGVYTACFPRSIMKVLLEFQREQLSQYRDQQDKRGGRKNR